MTSMFKQTDGWKVYTPQSRGGGKYNKYLEVCRIIVPKTADPFPRYFLITPLVYKALGNPARVQLAIRGNMWGIINAGEDDGHKVVKPKRGTMYQINCTTFMEDSKLRPGVYGVVIDDNGVVLCDILQTPSH